MSAHHPVLVFFIDSYGCNDPVPPAGKLPQHGPGFIPAARFTGKSHPPGRPECPAAMISEEANLAPTSLALADAAARAKATRVMASMLFFVDAARHHPEAAHDLLEQIPPSRRLRGKNDVLGRKDEFLGGLHSPLSRILLASFVPSWPSPSVSGRFVDIPLIITRESSHPKSPHFISKAGARVPGGTAKREYGPNAERDAAGMGMLVSHSAKTPPTRPMGFMRHQHAHAAVNPEAPGDGWGS